MARRWHIVKIYNCAVVGNFRTKIRFRILVTINIASEFGFLVIAGVHIVMVVNYQFPYKNLHKGGCDPKTCG